jgi:DNA helicase II / ATP-dependent DNA helicase PcrA
MDLMEYYDSRKNILDIERGTLFLLAEELNRFKKEKGLKDFTDLLEDFIEKSLPGSFEVLFIDEAQDLSLLQWEMVRHLWKYAKKTYIAGDDDQAIFKWAGADVDHFIALKEEVNDIKVLDQSYRIPGGPIHELSQRIINKVQNRFIKEYKPRDEIGLLKRYSDITQVDMSEGNWLVLSSANYFLDDAKDLCEIQGWYYQYKGFNSISLKLLLALNNWENWRKGDLLNHLEIKNIYEYLGSNVSMGFQKGKTLNSDLKYSMKECQEKQGLLTDKVWYDSFDGLDTMTENYIRNMRANGEAINKNPRIIMSTIHGAKGGEADKVLIMQDLTGAALETFSHDPDELHRLFYTGSTRAKRELHIVDPKNFDRAYIINSSIHNNERINMKEENDKYFLERQKGFLDIYEKEVNVMEKKFPFFAIDKTQIPCLLTMHIITFSKSYMTKKEFESYKNFVEIVLEGWRPPVQLKVIEGGKK